VNSRKGVPFGGFDMVSHLGDKIFQIPYFWGVNIFGNAGIPNLVVV